jgi:hypothetical protein
MNTKRIILAGCASLILSAGTAMAGPCDTSDRAANLKDAGSGPASTGSGQTTGMASDSGQHPPTGTMNRKTDDVAASSQDTQKQMQGQPTAAQEAQGAKPDRAANLKDAGSGPASTGSGQTTGMASDSGQHPPTGTMNRKTDDVAASSQDAQKQMQGQPTAAQEAQGAKPDAKTADKDC